MSREIARRRVHVAAAAFLWAPSCAARWRSDSSQPRAAAICTPPCAHGIDSNRGHAGEAERCSVAQQATARLAMIRANHKARYRSAWQKSEVVRGEELVHARAEGGVTAAQHCDLVGGDTRARSRAIADCRFKTIEVAGMNLRGFGCLYAEWGTG